VEAITIRRLPALTSVSVTVLSPAPWSLPNCSLTIPAGAPLGLTEADSEAETDGETEGLTDGETEAEGESEADSDGDSDALSEDEGDKDADSEAEGDKEGDSEVDSEGDSEDEGETEGLTDELGPSSVNAIPINPQSSDLAVEKSTAVEPREPASRSYSSPNVWLPMSSVLMIV
jgi:hypothetical protein